MSDQGTKRDGHRGSRRHFLKTAVKGGSLAALVGSGALDPLLRNLLLAAERARLSKQALEGRLPTKDLEALRDLLAGAYYRGGKFFRGDMDTKPPDEQEGGSQCREDFSEDGDLCPSHWCEGATCPDGYMCNGYTCNEVICGSLECGQYWPYGRLVDSRKLPGIDLDDVRKYAGKGSGGEGSGSSGGQTSPSNFLDEMMQIKGLDIRGLESEIRDMIINRSTFEDEGYLD